MLSGVPTKSGEDEWLAILSGRATSNLGVYKADTLEAEYSGGYKLQFRTPLQNAAFVVTDPPVRPPMLVADWEWAGS
jgi:hypothetical protein